MADSLERVAEKGGLAAARALAAGLIGRGLSETAAAVAGHRARLRLGAPGRAHPEQHEAPRTRHGASAASTAWWRHGRHRAAPAAWPAAVDHFCKVTRSYRPGLFHCYAVADLPRTNNDLEHLSARSATTSGARRGRKAASPAVVLRGEVRLIAAVATRQHPPSGAELGQRRSGTVERDSASGWNHAAKPESCAPASVAIRMPIWPNWNKKPASQLCRPSFFDIGFACRAAKHSRCCTATRARRSPSIRQGGYGALPSQRAVPCIATHQECSGTPSPPVLRACNGS